MGQTYVVRGTNVPERGGFNTPSLSLTQHILYRANGSMGQTHFFSSIKTFFQKSVFCPFFLGLGQTRILEVKQ